MSRSTKAPATPLPERIARARREGRSQQALELTRQLYKQSPSPEYQELLRQVSLERGTQLQQQGYTRDAATVFNNALNLGGSPEYRGKLIELLAAVGDVGRAMQALGPDADAQVRQRMLGHLADMAVRQGPAGRSTLPADLQAGFDTVLQAFAHSEAGRDDEARAALQTIGLTSPFLEWKVLLRGLLAYYARDDARAVENWQRLDTQRIPARLAAPLQLGIDAAFRAAQPAATQTALQQHASRLAGATASTTLMALRQALAHRKSLANALRLAEQIVPELQRHQPKLLPRLAHCVFWAIVESGHPEDLDRYHRVFGPTTNRVELARLTALALEHRDRTEDAHAAWQLVASAVAAAPQEWPGEIGKRAQALIWSHIGAQAAEYEDDDSPDMPSFMFDRHGKPAPLKPDAVGCFERSVALAPDRLEGYTALFILHRNHGDTAKAGKIGQELLKRFPDNAATSEALGDLYTQEQEPEKARQCYEKALSANPLERRLRVKLAYARRNVGQMLTVDKKYEAARAEYEAALALTEAPQTAVLCQWAVLELKAGASERAAELIARAQAAANQRLAVHFGLVSESIRSKLPTAAKKRLAADMKAAFEVPPTPAEVLALLEAAAQQRKRQLDPYHGQKTHERTFLGFLDSISMRDFNEDEIVKLCGYLQAMDARGPWQRCLETAEVAYPHNAMIALLHVDYLLSQKNSPTPWKVSPHLERARRLIQAMPREAQERLHPGLRQREQQAQKLIGSSHPMGMLDRIFGFGGFGGFDDGDDDFDDDEDDGW